MANQLKDFRADPISFLRNLATKSSDRTASFRIGRHCLTLLTEPSEIEELLVTKQRSFKKGPGLLRLRPLLGDGLLTADGERHWESRNRLAPAFVRTEIDRHINTIPGIVKSVTDAWPKNGEIDLHHEMVRITLAVVQATIFNCPAGVAGVSSVADGVSTSLQQLYAPLSRCPHERPQSIDDGATAFDLAVSGLIDNAAGQRDGQDIVSLLKKSDLSDQEVRDDVITFLLAGHESVATGLTWAFFALSQHPEVIGRLEAELEAETQTGYLDTVILESLRLYPPAWMFSRRATETVVIGEYTYTEGDIVVAAPCVTHVDSRFWSRPYEFVPSRWNPTEPTKTRARFAYFPFGGGRRRCIGEQFALNEMAVVLKEVLSSFRFDYADNQKPPEYEPLVTLRPSAALLMKCVKR